MTSGTMIRIDLDRTAEMREGGGGPRVHPTSWFNQARKSRPIRSRNRSVVNIMARAIIVGVVDHSYLITLLRLWLTMSSYPPIMLTVLAMRRAFAGGGADLTHVRSTVRPLAPPVYSTGYLRRVGHVGGPAVRGCDDLAARSAFVISFFPSREDLLEAPDEGAEDEVLCLTVGSRSS
ncbi:hypothetical protein BHE74_00005326 [Ensete ventricosum]|nr:hypothetical protein BHE74_00005326 [Ensete ventricosum]